MKRMVIPLLVLLLLLSCATGLAEESETVTLEVDTQKIPVYEAEDPFLDGLVHPEEGENLPVLVLMVQKETQLKVNVLPRSVKNKKFTLTAADEEVLQVKNNRLKGLQTGETLLTIASEQDPGVTVRYRVVVIRPVTRITVTAPEKSVAAGESMTLALSFLPEDATIRQVEWSSSDERIATVDAEGRVTGVKRGTARLIATAKDGSKVRANINLTVTQNAEEITLDQAELTVDIGRTAMLKATVLPKDTTDKNVIWTSGDESIATVNSKGRVTGVGLGECEILCVSKVKGDVQARAVVRVQQPVKSVTFGEAPFVYVNESAQLTWSIQPENASNPSVTFQSGNPKVLTVSEDGTVTGLSAGTATVTAITTDGSNRRANVKVRVGRHVESVTMKRLNAYIDTGVTSTTGAQISPKDATNLNMTWESADESVASVSPVKNQTHRVEITGVNPGTTTVTGTTEDGGLQASLTVHVGDYEHSLQLIKNQTYVNGDGTINIRVKNVSDLTITSVTATVTVTDVDGNPVPCNSKDDSNTFTVMYQHTIKPGETTKDSAWTYVQFKLPDSPAVSQYEVKVTEFQIDNDWVKVIRKKNQPAQKCPVHL